MKLPILLQDREYLLETAKELKPLAKYQFFKIALMYYIVIKDIDAQMVFRLKRYIAKVLEKNKRKQFTNRVYTEILLIQKEIIGLVYLAHFTQYQKETIQDRTNIMPESNGNNSLVNRNDENH